jgi:hypothetical protein
MIIEITKAIRDHLVETDGLIVYGSSYRLNNMYGPAMNVSLADLTDAGVAYVRSQGSPATVRRIIAYERLLNDPLNAKIGSLKSLPVALTAVMEQAPRCWVYSHSPHGHLLAWIATGIEHISGRLGSPAHVRLSLAAYRHSETETLTKSWTAKSIRGKTVLALLHEAGFMLANEQLNQAYDAELERYNDLQPLVGQQTWAFGMATTATENYWHRADLSLDVDGEQTKVVLDDTNAELREKRRNNRSSSIMTLFDMKDDVVDVDDEGLAVKLIYPPTQPYLYAFSLRHHEWVDVHIDSLNQYDWRDQIVDQLILPERDKRLIRLLVESTGQKMDDIVAGKSVGIIVAASGPPGVGKTLTAEAVSEVLHKPLYSVQCSQLGTNEEVIEKRLGLVLQRASRWGAVLLIDEADVYVRARGNDIHQNAIVGVFLRTLEYYRGFLFLTTNRATDIDDAILSRLTAHVRFELPDPEARARIVDVQAKSLGLDLSADALAALVTQKLSGRDIRSILKLAKFVSLAEGLVIDGDMIRFCIGYQDTTGGEA